MFAKMVAEAKRMVTKVTGINLDAIPHTIELADVKRSCFHALKPYRILIAHSSATDILVCLHEYGHLIHEHFLASESLRLGTEGKSNYAATNGQENFAEAFQNAVYNTINNHPLYPREERALAYLEEARKNGSTEDKFEALKEYFCDKIKSDVGKRTITIEEGRAWRWDKKPSDFLAEARNLYKVNGWKANRKLTASSANRAVNEALRSLVA